MKSLILWCFLSVMVLQSASLSTTKKIDNSKKDLSVTTVAKKKASRKLGEIAVDIKKAERIIKQLESKLEILNENKEKNEKQYIVLQDELYNSNKVLEKTSKEIEKKHKIFISLVSEQISVMFAMEQFKNPTSKSIISYEVCKTYKKHNGKEINFLENEIATLKTSKKDKEYQRDKIEKSIATIIKKRKSYKQKKSKKEKFVAKLGADEEKYEKKLHRLVDKQSSLRNTLVQLNILRGKEVAAEERRRAKARKEAIRLEKLRKRKIRKAKALALKKAKKAKKARQKIRLAKTEEAKKAARKEAKIAQIAAKNAQKKEKELSKQGAKVRKVNSSYAQPAMYAYRGKKTISPIPNAKVIKKFGMYMDPIYKIKVFNESITLKAPKPNALVKTVLPGSVVFAGPTSMLGKVVVIAHRGRIHTVYAGLSKISPIVKVGRNIKKGKVLGRVLRKLIFQATKNSKHINPSRLIRL